MSRVTMLNRTLILPCERTRVTKKNPKIATSIFLYTYTIIAKGVGLVGSQKLEMALFFFNFKA